MSSDPSDRGQLLPPITVELYPRPEGPFPIARATEEAVGELAGNVRALEQPLNAVQLDAGADLDGMGAFGSELGQEDGEVTALGLDVEANDATTAAASEGGGNVAVGGVLGEVVSELDAAGLDSVLGTIDAAADEAARVAGLDGLPDVLDVRGENDTPEDTRGPGGPRTE